MIQKIVVIGTGKVASHLIKGFRGIGKEIIQVVGRSEESIQRLEKQVGKVPYTLDKSQVRQDADLYLCSVKDDCIANAVEGISIPQNAILVHTAGSINRDVLAPYAQQIGVFYPMQTFSYGKNVDFSKIALYIEANNELSERKLYSFAKELSQNVKKVDSAMRAKVHMAAVFACNFSNHMFALAEEVLEEVNLPFSDLLPLIDETTEKVHQLSPKKAQTGPAIRRDEKVLAWHESQLSGRKKEIYKILSKSIQHD